MTGNTLTKEVQGKVLWISPTVGNFNGNSNVGIKIEGQNSFFNKYSENVEELQKIIDTVKKGYEIKVVVNTLNAIQSLEIVSDKIEESANGNWHDDMTNYEDLLNAAHEQAKKDKLRINMVSKPLCDGSGNPLVNFEKKTALYQAELTLTNEKGEVVQIIIDTGDAEGIANDTIKKHFNRMASTRAMARCYRVYTNNAKVAIEETGELPKEKPTESPKKSQKDSKK